MKIITRWLDTIPVPPKESGFTNTIWATCYRPDGSQVLVAVGDRVFIYDALTGQVVDQKRAHKGVVYALAYSKDGQRWASGAADQVVIVWSSDGVGILKYTHTAKIQCLAFNPVLQSLASCSDNDFGLWQTEGQQVNKFQTNKVKCLCADWSPDGQVLAIGMFNGTILLRDKNGAELAVIQKSADPVWTLQFCPQKFDTNDNILVAGGWDSKLSLYTVSGGKTVKPIGTDKELGFDPCSISFYPTGEYFVMAGSDREVTLWNKEGVKLGKIGAVNDWVWSVCVHPGTNSVFAGTNSGDLVSFNVELLRVHGLYQERYAYREQMTDVIIQHLVTETRVKIRCRDYIKKIAIYKDRLAVQLPEKIIIYSVLADDPFDMKYKAHKKINKRIDCSNLFVTSHHLILVFEKKIQLLAFSGILVREWIFEDTVRFVKIVSGPPKQESMIVGLANGVVSRVFIDNAFPVAIVRQTTGIQMVDISADKTKIAIVDEHKSMFVYDIKSQQLLFQEISVLSAAWNLEMDDMLAYTTKDTLFIKTREMPASQQKLPGYVVGFKGSKIFCLSDTSMNTIDVPQSSTFYRFLEKRDFQMAYKLACIGVTIQDWKALGIDALLAKEFVIARKAFCHIKELALIDLCETAEQMHQMRNLNEIWLASEVLALQGKFKEAATNYVKNNMLDKAITLLTQLKKFQEANDLIKKHGKKGGDQTYLDPIILIKQAEFERDSDNWKEAADLYIQANKHKEAIEIYGKRKNLDAIMDLCKNLDRQKHVSEIELCAKYFRAAGHHTFAKQAYLRLGDLKALMLLHVECEKWDEAFMLAKQNPEMEPMIFLPYADWLSAKDRFDEAQEAYKKAGRPDLSLRIIEFLTQNAINEKRYQDAAQYYWLLSTESLRLVQIIGAKGGKEDKRHLVNFNEYLKMAELYQAYHLVNRYIDDSYREVILGQLFQESAFNAALFLANNLNVKKVPLGINLVFVYYTIAKLGFYLEAYKSARIGFEKLKTLKVPNNWVDEIEVDALKIKCKPNSDREGIGSNSGPLADLIGQNAQNMAMQSVVNFCSFDSLPLVEFVPPKNLNPKKVLELLKADPAEDFTGKQPKKPAGKQQRNKAGGSGWNDEQEQVLSFTDNAQEETDLFTMKLLEKLDTLTGKEYKPIEVDERVLKSMRFEEVYIQDYSHFNSQFPKRYFKNIVADVAINMCENCCKFFIQDEYDFAYMELGHCPFCKHTEKDKGVKNVYGSLADMHQ